MIEKAKPATGLDDFERPLPSRALGRAGIIALLVGALLLGGWEIYWRSQGALAPYYRNSDGLWALERRRVNEGEGSATLLLGSSRMLFNVQLDVYEQEAGERPIQLALEGTSPIGVMEDLAGEADFTGTLLVGVAPILFFTGFEYRANAMSRFAQETPSQWLGQQISMRAEPSLAFYEYDFALFTILKRQPLPKRIESPWLMGIPGMYHDVRQLAYTERDRNTRLWSKLETDEVYRELAKTIWQDGYEPFENQSDEFVQGFRMNRDAQTERAVAATEKLNAKGVEVIFVSHPYEGIYETYATTYVPREETWDVLIERTGALGLHWKDHEEMQGYWLPEWSHMTGAGADEYTEALYHLIQRERLRQANDTADPAIATPF